MPNMTKLDLGEKVEVLITKLTVMEEKIDHLTTDLKEANRKIEELYFNEVCQRWIKSSCGYRCCCINPSRFH